MKNCVIVFALCSTFMHAQVGFKVDNTFNTIDSTKKTTIINHGDTLDNVYETMSLINYNFSMKLMQPKVERRNQLFEKLSLGSNPDSPMGAWTPLVIAATQDTIKALDREISEMEAKQDSLYFSYITEFVNYEKIMFLPNSNTSRAFFDIMYDNNGSRFKAIGNSGLNFGDSTTSIYSEIASGNMGLLRIAFGSMITSSSSENDSTAKSNEAYQRLITSGGNTVLSAEYPLLYIHSRNNQYNFIARPIAKATMDLPAFGSSTEVLTGSTMISMDVYADAATDNGSLRFFTNFNYSYLWGTKDFKANLGTDNQQFSFGQLTIGLVFLQNYKISFILATLSSEPTLQHRKIIAGGQVLR